MKLTINLSPENAERDPGASHPNRSKQFDGHLPASFRGEVRKFAAGRFDLHAELIGER